MQNERGIILLHDYGTSVSKFRKIIVKSKRRGSLKESSIKKIKILKCFLKLNTKLIWNENKFASIRTIIIIIELKNLKKIIYNSNIDKRFNNFIINL